MKYIILCLLFLLPVFCQEKVEQIGIEEKLGEIIPLDLEFLDETGQTIALKQAIDRPVILSLVYFRCPGICTPLLNGLKDTLNKLNLDTSKDFKVITISFNPEDTPEMALQKRDNYLKQIDRNFPKESWRFFTGKQENITKLTDSVGYYYKKEGNEFRHPGALIILSPQGKITRYLYGLQQLPFDVQMALIEASQGRVGPTIAKLLQYCFTYDPQGKKYALNVIRLSGAGVVFLLAIFILYLGISNRLAKKKVSKSSELKS